MVRWIPDTFPLNYSYTLLEEARKVPQAAASEVYVSFGLCRFSPPYPTAKLFTGQRLDSTGLYYYNARYYDSTIGRFISPDTIGTDYNNPQSLNRYTYCLNNPLNQNDPTGHWSWKTFFKTVAKIAAVVTTAVIVVATIAAAVATTNPVLIGAAVGECVSTTTYIVKSVARKEEITTSGILGAVIKGGISGVIASTGVGLVSSMFMGGVANTMGIIGGDITEKLVCKTTGEVDHSSDINPIKIVSSFTSGAFAGGLGQVGSSAFNGIRIAAKDGVDATINQFYYNLQYGDTRFGDSFWLSGFVSGLGKSAYNAKIEQALENLSP